MWSPSFGSLLAYPSQLSWTTDRKSRAHGLSGKPIYLHSSASTNKGLGTLSLIIQLGTPPGQMISGIPLCQVQPGQSLFFPPLESCGLWYNRALLPLLEGPPVAVVRSLAPPSIHPSISAVSSHIPAGEFRQDLRADLVARSLTR